MSFAKALACVFSTLLLTVYGQIIIKWQVSQMGSIPGGIEDKIHFFIKLLLNPWIMSGLFAAVLASLFWMAAMTRLPLSYAYPFMSLSFPIVAILSVFIFSDTIHWPQFLGIGLIVSGLIFIQV